MGSGVTALLACLAVVYATPRDAFWVVDCGSKALVAQRLLETGFSDPGLDYPAAHLDPAGVAFPIPPPFALQRGDRFVSQYPLAFSALAAPFAALFGPPGLRMPAALGVACCALLFALWIAGALGARWGATGGLALALASPLFFYGVVVWEHSLTAALPLASVVLLTRASVARVAAAGALAALACLLRAELALMGIALAAALAWQSRRWGSLLLFGAGAAPVLGLWLAGNSLLYGDPLGVHVTENVGPDAELLRQGLPLLLRRTGALLGGAGWGRFEALALGLAAPLCLGLGLGAARRERSAWLAALLLAVGLAGSLYASWRISTAAVPYLTLARYNGLLLQVPALALTGLGAARVFQRPEYGSLRLGVLAGLLFLGLAIPFRVTLTLFETGGFWGPRMLVPGLPVLMACALVALHAQRPLAARAATAALIGVGLASTSVSVQVLAGQKREVARLQQRMLDAAPPVVVTNHPALGQQLAATWGSKPLLFGPTDPALAGLSRRLGRAGVEEFLLVYRGRAGAEPTLGAAARCRSAGRHRGREAPVIFDLDLYRCRPAAGRLKVGEKSAKPDRAAALP